MHYEWWLKTSDMVKWKLLCLLGLAFMFLTEKGSAAQNCTDFKKQIVVQGERFIPLGYDPCMTCTCEKGDATMCTSVLCSPPKDCLNTQLADYKCCEFLCKNGDIDHHPIFNITDVENKDIETFNNTNLGLRLVASTVTSFLILALLLFMIHRLRQRRLLLMIRRFNNLNPGPCSNRRFTMRDNGSVGYYPHHDHVAFGYFEDPPPPYSFWKPPESYFSQEAPPPYEIALNADRIISPVCSPPLSTGLNMTYQLPLPSLSSISLHTNNFEINDLDRERSEDNHATAVPLHSLNVTGSMSSLHENNVNVDADHDAMAIRSDATYEESPLYKNQINENSNSSLYELPSNETNCNLLINEMPQASSSNKYHSYNDVVDCWQRAQHEEEISDQMKRHSLQSPLHKKGRVTRFPDPTSWIGDASESSSSSSPTYEQRTLSPTSSDSSSIEYNLPGDNDCSRFVSSFRQKSLDYHLCSATLLPSSDVTTEIVNPRNDFDDYNQTKKKLGIFKKNKGNEMQTDNSSRHAAYLQKESNERLFVGSGSTKLNLDINSKDLGSVCKQMDKITYVPRISYVSDGEDQNTNTVAKCVKNKILPSAKKRPKSYDFGNLSVTRSYSVRNSADFSGACEEKPCSSLQPGCYTHVANGIKDTDCSFDSLTYSSQASFGSTSSSSGRVDPACPSSSSPVHVKFETPVNGSHNDHVCSQGHRSRESDSSSAFSASASGSGDLSHSRSASICSETGERRHQGCLAESRNTEYAADPSCAQNPRMPRNSHQIRTSMKNYKQNQESYI